MNVFDFLLGESGFLDKDVLLGNREQISYRDLYDKALKLAHYLRNSYGQHQNIILVAPNSIFFLVAYLAIMKSGNVCVPLNPDVEDNNLSYILELCDAKIAFVSPLLQGERWKHIPNIYYELPEIGSSFTSGERFDASELEDEQLAEIIFTSGSTGEPKGVMITHRNIIANTQSIIHYLGLTDEDIVEVVLPFYYCYGLSLLHTHLRVGGSLVFNNNFMFLGSVINDLNKYKCTGFAGVPSHFQILLRKSTSFKSTHFSSLRYVTQAGGKLHNVFIREFAENFPEIDFFVMYGQTEATARLAYLPPEKVLQKLGSMGKAIPGVKLDILDETGIRISEPGKVGELIASGANVMKGYLADEEDTANALRDGWLHTGDLAYRDEEGYFFLTARLKEIIKVGGRRISPKEVEEALVAIPGVVDCTISGIYDEILGEALKAEIVLAGNNTFQPGVEEFKKICAERLAPEKVPQIFEFKQNLEIAATGKKVKRS